VAPDNYAWRFEVARKTFRQLSVREGVDPAVDALWRELLATCRRQDIRVVAVIAMPEGDDYRRLYAPGTRRGAHDYFSRLCEEYGTRFVDASDWIDRRYFLDGQHLLAAGARQLTERYWHEVYLPAAVSGRCSRADAPR
jgi:hypothetical protein